MTVDVERIDVDDLDTDLAPKIAINEALGCRKVAEMVRFTKVR